ncbi:MAG: hypothetical protein CVU54_13175 [Deltaproteobacteria bacterium HGW-Deltaproteobacteria-12]|jgi:hypothetical protein|nr:MAG: hypothetical protein CVU54_13175 [Deltaproteobacteria bacterium HGW-Deltaproteobacteria-12]
MKRFWLVLLSLGLIIAFSTSAMAVDVKVSGQFYTGGIYLDKTTLKKDTATDGPSTALYFQRLRVQTEFIVSPGLSLVTRFDAMERAWGATRSTPGTTLDTQSQGTKAENENIAFDLVYVSYNSPIGNFRVGYQPDSNWGLPFGNSPTSIGEIRYTTGLGPLTLLAYIAKTTERSSSAIAPSIYSDTDDDKWFLAGIYTWKGGRAGLGYQGQRAASARPAATGFPTWPNLGIAHAFMPFISAKLGPITVQSEVTYAFGNYKEENVAVAREVKLDNLSAILDVEADLGKFYAGGTVAYVSGDDPGTTDKLEGGLVTGGNDWNPCLIMWNYDRQYWAGSLVSYAATRGFTGSMANAWFFQGRAGVRPTAGLNLGLAVAYATADKKPSATWLYNNYGTEIDLTATYKITNNLSYMLGFGYLMTGDYFKGTSDANQVTNDYLVINKLTLTF